MLPVDLSTSRRSFASWIGVGAAWAALRPLLEETPLGAAESVLPSSTVRLSANENPYGPPPAALAAIGAALPLACRYPDRAADELAAALAAECGVAVEQVALGSGSSQILHAAAAAFCGPGGRAVTADPTFEALGHYAEVRGAVVKRVPLTADHRHDLVAMASAAGDNGLIYVCNPNNPTATVTPARELRALLDRLPPSAVLLVDEAYHHYATGAPDYESVIPWLARYPNLVVTRTFSKIYGMAGLRVGCALASRERAAAIERQLSWDSVNAYGLVAARAALDEREHVEQACRRNAQLREWTCAELGKSGVRTLPSAANFFMADLGSDVKPVIAALHAEGVDVGRRFPAMPNHLRVTVGTESEMTAFLDAFRRTVVPVPAG